MKPHIEKEYKMLLSREQYESLQNSSKEKSFVQVNHYYSTHQPDNALRIREVDGKFLLTLKVRENDYRKEYEFYVSGLHFNDEESAKLLNEFSITEPEYLGKMSTERTVIHLEYGEICLDKSEYLGKTDYELEYELYDYTTDSDREMRDYLEKNGIGYIPNTVSKFRRFLDARGA